MPLTPEELTLTHDLFRYGPAALTEASFTGLQAAEFLQREDVRQELTSLQKEMDQFGDLEATNQFYAKRALSRLTRPAIEVVASVLRGPTYVRTPLGHICTDAFGNPIMLEPLPPPIQLSAAHDVLDRLGINAKQEIQESGGRTLKNLFDSVESRVEIEYNPDDKSDEQKTISRERRRSAMLVLRGLVDAIRADVDKETPKVKIKKSYWKKKGAKQVNSIVVVPKIKKKPAVSMPPITATPTEEKDS